MNPLKSIKTAFSNLFDDERQHTADHKMLEADSRNAQQEQRLKEALGLFAKAVGRD